MSASCKKKRGESLSFTDDGILSFKLPDTGLVFHQDIHNNVL